MSKSGPNPLIVAIEGWALTIGQPVLVLLVFALYSIEAWTSGLPSRLSEPQSSKSANEAPPDTIPEIHSQS